VLKSRLYLLIFLFSLFITVNAQDLVTKKTDHSIVYIDSLLYPGNASSAVYYGYIPGRNYYLNINSLQLKDLKQKLVYTPFSDTIFDVFPKPLHGEISVISNKENGNKFDHFYVFHLGTLAQVKEPSKKGEHLEVSYLDSLKNNDPSTFARYVSENNILVYKQYLNKNGNKSHSEKIFVIEHKTFTSKLKPVFGLYWNLGPDEEMKHNSHTFLELGICKQFLRGTSVNAVGKTYYDNLFAFHSGNLSLLGTSRNGITYLGQKLTYSYTYMFFKGEAGILNYTDLNKDDVRCVAGLGFSFLARLSGMCYYSLSLTKNEFKDLGRISIGLVFH
jgi:hypothetical protein